MQEIIFHSELDGPEWINFWEAESVPMTAAAGGAELQKF